MRFTIKDFLNPSRTKKELPYDPQTTGVGESPVKSRLLSDIEKKAEAETKHVDTEGYDSIFEVPHEKITFDDLKILGTTHNFDIEP